VPGVPLPNPTPTPVPKPDLVVPLVVARVYRDDPLGCTVNYRRGNEGTVAAGASTTSVELASPGQVTLTSTIAAVPLAPGQSQQESIVFPGINCDPDVYTVTATVTADSTNAVDESSETNNSRSRTFAPG
jgi:subtilase family serine protease